MIFLKGKGDKLMKENLVNWLKLFKRLLCSLLCFIFFNKLLVK